MSSISFTIPFACTAKQADRSRTVNTRDGRSFVQHYQSAEVKENAATLASLIAPHRPSKPMSGPLHLSLTFRFAWRKGESKKWLARGQRWKDTKPDWDNLAKQVGDVLERSGFMGNDSQIACAYVEKRWADSPGIDVTLRELEEAL